MNDNKDINDLLNEIDKQRTDTGEEPAEPVSVPDETPEPIAEEPVYEASGQENFEQIQPEQPAPEAAAPAMEYPAQGTPVYPQGQQRPMGTRPPVGPDGRPIQRRKKHKKKKKRSNRLPGVLFLITLIFGTSVILSLVIIGYGKDMLGIDKSDSTHVIVIPDGSTTEEVSIMLQEEGIIKSAKAFQLFSRLRKSDKYISGEHFIKPNMAYETIITELTQIKTAERGESVEVTFPEGISIYDAARILEDEGICDSSDFIFYFNGGEFGLDFEKRLPAQTDTTLKFKKMEGYLFPDTYIFYKNSKPEEVCQKIYYNFDTKMTDERYEKMKKLNLTLDQLVTFASMVQAEAGRKEDMEDIASVFWNRLENHDDFPRLESDPTQNYAKKIIRPNMEYYDQTIVDAYDTYKSTGLPPGAIGNPGLDAIDAVLAHKSTDYFYFNANINTKVTYFAHDIDTHNANLDKVKQEYEEEERLRQEAEAAEQGY